MTSGPLCYETLQLIGTFCFAWFSLTLPVGSREKHLVTARLVRKFVSLHWHPRGCFSFHWARMGVPVPPWPLPIISFLDEGRVGVSCYCFHVIFSGSRGAQPPYYSVMVNALTTWCEEPAHQKRPWCWESLKAGGEGDDGGQDSRMASLTQWTCVWASSRRWWRTGKPGVLQSMGSQRVRHEWVTEQQQQQMNSSIIGRTCCWICWLLSHWALCSNSVHNALRWALVN